MRMGSPTFLSSGQILVDFELFRALYDQGHLNFNKPLGSLFDKKPPRFDEIVGSGLCKAHELLSREELNELRAISDQAVEALSTLEIEFPFSRGNDLSSVLAEVGETYWAICDLVDEWIEAEQESSCIPRDKLDNLGDKVADKIKEKIDRSIPKDTKLSPEDLILKICVITALNLTRFAEVIILELNHLNPGETKKIDQEATINEVLSYAVLGRATAVLLKHFADKFSIPEKKVEQYIDKLLKWRNKREFVFDVESNCILHHVENAYMLTLVHLHPVAFKDKPLNDIIPRILGNAKKLCYFPTEFVMEAEKSTRRINVDGFTLSIFKDPDSDLVGMKIEDSDNRRVSAAMWKLSRSNQRAKLICTDIPESEFADARQRFGLLPRHTFENSQLLLSLALQVDHELSVYGEFGAPALAKLEPEVLVAVTAVPVSLAHKQELDRAKIKALHPGRGIPCKEVRKAMEQLGFTAHHGKGSHIVITGGGEGNMIESHGQRKARLISYTRLWKNLSKCGVELEGFYAALMQ